MALIAESPNNLPVEWVIYASRISAALGFRSIYVLREGLNPTGSHKYRAAAAMAAFAARNGFTRITVGTCGHMGVAIAYAARQHGLNSVVYVSRGICQKLATKLNRLGADVRYVNGSYEQTVFASRQLAQTKPDYFDANPGGCHRDLALDAYADLAVRIVEGTRLHFESVWVPCGNGTTVAGLSRGFLRHGTVPRLCAVGSLGNSALARSFSIGRLTELNADELSETGVNRPLVNWSALDGDEALSAVINSNGWIVESSDSEMCVYAALLQRYEALTTHPSSAAALAGFAATRECLNKEAPHLIILTT